MNAKGDTIRPLKRGVTNWSDTVKDEEAWRRLADLLRHKRVVELRERSRAAFARKLGISDRVLHDLENARRDTYEVSTLLSLESWYGLTPDELRGALGGLYPNHEITLRHDIATVQSARTSRDQKMEELQEAVNTLAAILDTLRDELPEWSSEQQGK